LNPQNDADRANSSANCAGDGSRAPATTVTKSATSGGADENLAKISHRRALIAALADAIRDGISAGDLAAVRVAHEAIGRLLVDATDEAGDVIDLANERAKRPR
jgi:hypothetical protein